MNVTKGKKVSIEYTLTLHGVDKAVDSNVGGEPLVYEHGGSQIITGLENALEGMKVGESKDVEIQPEEAYGPVLKESIVSADKSEFPEEMQKVGTPVQGKSPEGQVVTGRVAEVGENNITVNFNHPLAGQTLCFKVKVLDIK